MTCNNPIFIIPARGGSKGIPGKNIIPLAGKPLIAYTVETALKVVSPKRIFLTTDSDEIASVVRGMGIAVDYIRPAHLATDTSGSREVILDMMSYVDSLGVCYDSVVLLQPTSPLRAADDIRGALSLYSPDVDMVVSVTETSANPYYNCFEADAEGFLHVSKGDGLITRRQDAPKAWEYNGSVYVINPASIRAMAMGEFPRRVPYEMPRERSIDIDTPIDLAVAELLIAQSAINQSALSR